MVSKEFSHYVMMTRANNAVTRLSVKFANMWKLGFNAAINYNQHDSKNDIQSTRETHTHTLLRPL